MNKIQKILDLTCQECFSAYQLLEKHSFQAKQTHQQELKSCAKNCLSQWKNLLHDHYQEQIILHLAQEEAQKDHE